MTAVFHRHSHARLPITTGGDGCYTFDETGNRYLDACGGAAVSCLGHSNAKVRETLHRQIDMLAYAHTGFFTPAPTEDLAKTLVVKAPGELSHAYIVSSGSEAIEAALKLSRQYFLEKDEGKRLQRALQRDAGR